VPRYYRDESPRLSLLLSAEFHANNDRLVTRVRQIARTCNGEYSLDCARNSAGRRSREEKFRARSRAETKSHLPPVLHYKRNGNVPTSAVNKMGTDGACCVAISIRGSCRYFSYPANIVSNDSVSKGGDQRGAPAAPVTSGGEREREKRKKSRRA